MRLSVFIAEGKAVPLTKGADVTSTARYPGWAFSKAERTSDQLAQRVADALREGDVDTNVDGMSYRSAGSLLAITPAFADCFRI